ncbi:hypothetical protein ACQ86N_39380 [Puia sp. P3]|uniref:hypothetical protein n=1 Tax=Puia sp. P3 TaxID=3423952 RepID=UPI003D678957
MDPCDAFRSAVLEYQPGCCPTTPPTYWNSHPDFPSAAWPCATDRPVYYIDTETCRT